MMSQQISLYSVWSSVSVSGCVSWVMWKLGEQQTTLIAEVLSHRPSILKKRLKGGRDLIVVYSQTMEIRLNPDFQAPSLAASEEHWQRMGGEARRSQPPQGA